MTWTLVNGEGRVRKAPNEAYDTPVGGYDGIANIDESQCFYGNPSQYDWTYIAKKEMLVAYNNNNLIGTPIENYVLPGGPNPNSPVGKSTGFGWWRRICIPAYTTYFRSDASISTKTRDSACWAKSYDGNGDLQRAYIVATRVVPSIPMVNPVYICSFDLQTTNYVCQGQFSYGKFTYAEYNAPNEPSLFQPQEMAANASF